MVDNIQVTHIGRNAFSFKETLEVQIPNTIYYIEDYAFSHNNIIKIHIPNSVFHIGKNDFQKSDYDLNQYLKIIIIFGDQKRFNSDWKKIGFPSNRMTS